MTDERLIRAVAWRRLDVLGTEVCRLSSRDDGEWEIDGSAVVLLDGDLVSARYAVRVDERFVTREAWTVRTSRDDEASRSLDAADGRWRTADVDVPELKGCVDVDLGFTPATNTLPIRRLGLNVGESAEIDAAWIRFPELTVERLPQRYTRIAADRYRYESRDSGFTAELEVDDEGLVVAYEDLWERVGSVDG